MDAALEFIANDAGTNDLHQLRDAVVDRLESDSPKRLKVHCDEDEEVMLVSAPSRPSAPPPGRGSPRHSTQHLLSCTRAPRTRRMLALTLSSSRPAPSHAQECGKALLFFNKMSCQNFFS